MEAKCGNCGGLMSQNPHPNAGLPGVVPDYVQIGTKEVCIPCTCQSRHSWSERAMKAEAQAEATWKAAFEAGMRKVVEWIREHSTKEVCEYQNNNLLQRSSVTEWSAQLKVWFKDEPELLKEWGYRITEQLRELITNWLKAKCYCWHKSFALCVDNCSKCALLDPEIDEILALVKQAGWIPPEEAKKMVNLADDFSLPFCATESTIVCSNFNIEKAGGKSR